MLETEIADTLALVNVARQAFNLDPLRELPDSNKGQSSDCLYYRGLMGCGVSGVGSSTITFEDERKARMVAELWGVRADGVRVQQPRQMTRVIEKFDHNELPHYTL